MDVGENGQQIYQNATKPPVSWPIRYTPLMSPEAVARLVITSAPKVGWRVEETLNGTGPAAVERALEMSERLESREAGAGDWRHHERQLSHAER